MRTLDASKLVVVDFDAVDRALACEHFGLWFDLLGHKHPFNRGEAWVLVEELEVAAQLLDAVDLAAALDLNCDHGIVFVATQEIDRTNICWKLTSHERVAIANRGRVGSQEFLQVSFDAVLLKSGVLAQVPARIAQDFVNRDDEALAFGANDSPFGSVFDEAVWGVHPIQWLIRSTIGMDRHAAVGLNHDEALRLGEMSSETAVVVDGAAGDDKAHEAKSRTAFEFLPFAPAGATPQAIG